MRVGLDRPASGRSLTVHAACSMRKVFFDPRVGKRDIFESTVRAVLRVPHKRSPLTCPSPVYWMDELDRRAGRAISVRACSDVTNQMQLHTFARLFQGQHRPIWCQTESPYFSNSEAAQSSACCWGKKGWDGGREK
ncbi:hypothetical protein PMIN06_007022 [Paraphaeosphaeria minitans]